MKRDDDPRPRAYLAASSRELDRAKLWRDRLTAGGVRVLASWIDNVERVGEANPRTATKQQRLMWATSNIREMQAAQVLWFLAPQPTTPNCGGWYEAGFAYCAAQRVVFSGDTKQSIYCSTGLEFDSDEEACLAILGMLEIK